MLLLQRVLFEQLLSGVELDAAWVGIADGFYLGGLDGFGFVAEAVADEGEDGGHFIVFQHAGEGSHRHLTIVFFAVQFQRTHEAVHGQLDEAIWIARDPLAFLQSREGRIQALAVWLVTGHAGATVGPDRIEEGGPLLTLADGEQAVAVRDDGRRIVIGRGG